MITNVLRKIYRSITMRRCGRICSNMQQYAATCLKLALQITLKLRFILSFAPRSI